MQYFQPQQLGGAFAQPQGFQGVQGFAARGQPFAPSGFTMAPQAVAAPLTPKIGAGPTVGEAPAAQVLNSPGAAQKLSMAAPQGMMGAQNLVSAQRPMVAGAFPDGSVGQPTFIRGGMGREQALEQRVRELESLVLSKDKKIQDLQSELALFTGKPGQKGANSKVRSPGRSGSGFRKVAESKPVIRYSASDQDDPIDVRLEEFYNSTGSAIQFRRINRGFYRFGDTIVELDIINHKLMARTEDGWNRGKFGPVEKFLMYYENIEREKAGILPEA